MRTIFNLFVGIPTLLDIRYRYLGSPAATDNGIIEMHQSLDQLKTQMKLLGEEVVGEIKWPRKDMEGKAKERYDCLVLEKGESKKIFFTCICKCVCVCVCV
jgi:hypothetical protein